MAFRGIRAICLVSFGKIKEIALSKKYAVNFVCNELFVISEDISIKFGADIERRTKIEDPKKKKAEKKKIAAPKSI